MHDVAAEYDVLRRQPDQAVPRGVGRANPAQFQGGAAEREVHVLVEGFVRIHGLSTGHAFGAHQIAEHEQLLFKACPLVLDRGCTGDVSGAALFEVSVAQPAVILPAAFDHHLDRLVGDRPDEHVDRRHTLVAAAGIDQHDILVGHDETEGRVVAQVLGRAVAERADDGVDLIADLLQAQAITVTC
ncbi:MAG TPA: hypothetical protein PLI17_14385 [Denitromonas sp.]|nr:hypothetical protein [Denitromonas sp.]